MHWNWSFGSWVVFYSCFFSLIFSNLIEIKMHVSTLFTDFTITVLLWVTFVVQISDARKKFRFLNQNIAAEKSARHSRLSKWPFSWWPYQYEYMSVNFTTFSFHCTSCLLIITSLNAVSPLKLLLVDLNSLRRGNLIEIKMNVSTLFVIYWIKSRVFSKTLCRPLRLKIF